MKKSILFNIKFSGFINRFSSGVLFCILFTKSRFRKYPVCIEYNIVGAMDGYAIPLEIEQYRWIFLQKCFFNWLSSY